MFKKNIYAMLLSNSRIHMHSFAKIQFPLLCVHFFCSCDELYHKQVVRFLLYLLSQIVTWLKIIYVRLWMILIDSWEAAHYSKIHYVFKLVRGSITKRK